MQDDKEHIIKIREHAVKFLTQGMCPADRNNILFFVKINVLVLILGFSLFTFGYIVGVSA